MRAGREHSVERCMQDARRHQNKGKIKSTATKMATQPSAQFEDGKIAKKGVRWRCSKVVGLSSTGVWTHQCTRTPPPPSSPSLMN
jgi:hypothetical protein